MNHFRVLVILLGIDAWIGTQAVDFFPSQLPKIASGVFGNPGADASLDHLDRLELTELPVLAPPGDAGAALEARQRLWRIHLLLFPEQLQT